MRPLRPWPFPAPEQRIPEPPEGLPPGPWEWAVAVLTAVALAVGVFWLVFG